MELKRSRELLAALEAVVPGGSHTYAKGADQYPVFSPAVLTRGEGCHVWDADGNRFIEYGMGLRAVTLGHAYAPVVEAVRAALADGTNFTRPSVHELRCAEALLEMIPGAEMVKFTKDGSTTTSAAIKLARAHTGRDKVGLCTESGFFSYDDWFIGKTSMHAGIPQAVRDLSLTFDFNDLDSARALFAAHPGEIAALILEPARGREPEPGYLEALKALCEAEGAVLVFDEMITGFRWHNGGAQGLYGVTPHLSTFGKALANGFALSALAGDRELMQLGAHDERWDQVFLLSTTHGAEIHTLAAAMEVMRIYREEPVVEHLHRQGERLTTGVAEVTQRHGVERYFELLGRPCNLVFACRDPEGRPSQAYRSLFIQEMARRGVIGPSFVTSYSHSDADIDATIEAVDGALGVYVRALEDGADAHLVGRPSRMLFTH